MVQLGGHGTARTHRFAEPDGKPKPVGFTLVSGLRWGSKTAAWHGRKILETDLKEQVTVRTRASFKAFGSLFFRCLSKAFWL